MGLVGPTLGIGEAEAILTAVAEGLGCPVPEEWSGLESAEDVFADDPERPKREREALRACRRIWNSLHEFDYRRP